MAVVRESVVGCDEREMAEGTKEVSQHDFLYYVYDPASTWVGGQRKLEPFRAIAPRRPVTGDKSRQLITAYDKNYSQIKSLDQVMDAITFNERDIDTQSYVSGRNMSYNASL